MGTNGPAQMKRIRLSDLAEMVELGKVSAVVFCYRCHKIAYATRQDARNAGREMRAKGKGHTCAYQCKRNPDWWHLTSKKTP